MKEKNLGSFFFVKHNLICTAIIFLTMGGLSFVPLNSDLFNPIEQAFSDFEATDLVFSLMKDEQEADTNMNIVIVNIGKLPREGIADLVINLSRFQPKAIGIDAFFREPMDSVYDLYLQAAFAQAPQMVLVSELKNLNEEKMEYDSLATSNRDLFLPFVETGFANLITEGVDEFRTSRTFSPSEKVRGNLELAFPVKMVSYLDPNLVKEFLARGKKVEITNYTGNFEKFITIDWIDALDPNIDFSIIKDKLVFMGYMGDSLNHNTWGEDKFFTPLNKKFAGKSYPDMYGIVVHANIAQMILKQDYLDELSDTGNFSLSVLIGLLNVFLYSFLLMRFPITYGAITILMQLFQTIAIIFFEIMVFKYMKLKIDLTIGILSVIIGVDIVDFYYSMIVFRKNRRLINK